jgi:chitosanase
VPSQGTARPPTVTLISRRLSDKTFNIITGLASLRAWQAYTLLSRATPRLTNFERDLLNSRYGGNGTWNGTGRDERYGNKSTVLTHAHLVLQRLHLRLLVCVILSGAFSVSASLAGEQAPEDDGLHQLFDKTMDMGRIDGVGGGGGAHGQADWGDAASVDPLARDATKNQDLWTLRTRKKIVIDPKPTDLIYFDNTRGYDVKNGETTRLHLKERWTGSIRLEYKIRFSDKFEWSEGGQLPGILGGRWWCTPRHRSKNCWALQVGWGPDGSVELRSKIPQAARSVPRQASMRFETGVWYTISMYVRVNSRGRRNGETYVWINGELLGGDSGMVYSKGSTRSVYVMQSAAYLKDSQVPESHPSGSLEYVLLKDYEVDQVKRVSLAPPPPPPSPPPSPLPSPSPIPTENPSEAVPSSPSDLPSAPAEGPYVWEDLSPDQYRRARQLTSIFENSKLDYQYGFCKDIGDGRGYTFGFCGFTTKYSDSKKVLREYLLRRPDDVAMQTYLDKLDQKVRGSDGKEGLDGFCTRVGELGDDPDFIAAQEAIQLSEYYNPSKVWSQKLGMRLAISKGEMYDAMINHGEGRGDPFSIDHIVDKTNAAMGGAPIDGVDEVQWLDSFLTIRAQTIRDLANWQAKRIDFYRELLHDGNLNLDGPIWVQLQDQVGGWTINNVYYGKFEIYSSELSQMQEGAVGLIS